jgi:hypothetical protein
MHSPRSRAITVHIVNTWAIHFFRGLKRLHPNRDGRSAELIIAALVNVRGHAGSPFGFVVARRTGSVSA